MASCQAQTRRGEKMCILVRKLCIVYKVLTHARYTKYQNCHMVFYWAKVSIYSEIHTEHMNIICKQKEECYNGKHGVM
jgi:hypothetical protein